MSRGRPDGSQKKKVLTSVLVLMLIFGCVYLYSRKSGSSPLEYGSKSLRKFGSYLGSDEDTDEPSSKLDEDGDDGIVLKSFPVSEPLLS